MFYNPRGSDLIPGNRPEYPGLPAWDPLYHLDWQTQPAERFPPDIIVFEPQGVYFFYGQPTLGGGLGGFWGDVGNWFKGAGKWVKGAWESWGSDVYGWIQERGGPEAVKAGACVFDSTCATYYVLAETDASAQRASFRRATTADCLGKQTYDASGIPGWNTPKDCQPGAPPVPPAGPPGPTVTASSVFGGFGSWIENNWQLALMGSVGLYFLTQQKRRRPVYDVARSRASRGRS